MLLEQFQTQASLGALMPDPHGSDDDVDDEVSDLVEKGYGVSHLGHSGWAEGHPTVDVGDDEVVLDVNGKISGTVDPKTGQVTWIRQH